ncbi:MAG TPA: Asp23/Gls24 family envelope stress response protein, partial [Candidatus Limnocylindrales bacterium]|nr:Asp23/Gls24 family envelope stress response protein [Candidatus Limnocylindrales bacterium]
MPTKPKVSTPGRSLVTRRAVIDIVRAATLGSYGVVGLTGGGPAGWLAERLGLAPRGIRVAFEDHLTIELDLVVGHGLPVAEVARQ